ncbi:MAG: hypothetical protein JXA23_09240 [Bacteroidales bacterium]|nr:hypothetical protein [Bacteroidales bacterium]
MKKNKLSIGLVVALIFLIPGPGSSQGIKGQETRRHTIRLTKNESRRTKEEGRGKIADASSSNKLILMVGQPSLLSVDTEVAAAANFVDGLDDYSLIYSTFQEIKKHPKLLDGISMLWFHRSDSLEFFREESDPKVVHLIREYLEQGGRILLTLNAFPYINLLGIETSVPSVKIKASVDEGYGRKLGFHAFREHPLFTGLNGGSYIYKPDHDLTVRVNGFFGDTLPAQGKVVAIDWDYIFFREHSKVIVEYDVGKGKLIAVGAYTLFSVPNENRPHLELFTRNCLDYLTGKPEKERRFYWDYSQPVVVPCTEKTGTRDKSYSTIPDAVSWDITPDSLSFPIHSATNAYCEAAGERLLIMGQEKGGLEEVWSHPFMALRDLNSGIRYAGADSIIWLDKVIPEIEIRTDGFIRHYHLDNNTLDEIVVADPTLPVGVIHYSWDGAEPVELAVHFRTNLRLMWPYPAESTGSIFYGWDQDLEAFYFTDRSGDMAVMVGGNKVPVAYDAHQGEGFSADAAATYFLKPGESLDLVIASGNEGLQTTETHFEKALRYPRDIFVQAGRHVDDLFEKSLLLMTPDANFNKGYRWALLGSDRFFVTTPGMGSALVAGYGTTRRGWDGSQAVSGRPGYAWYFGRDGQWSGFALKDYGASEKVRKNLEFFMKYQDLNGKIFHEATTSGVIHYDASDATPLFLVLAGHYYLKTGDTAFIMTNWKGIKKAIDYCFSTDTDQDHLIENTNVGHGWVEGGSLFGSHSSFYLTGCWFAALEAAGKMAEAVGDHDAFRYKQEARVVKQQADKVFWEPKKRFYAYGINQDGSQRPDLTILPTVPAYFGITEEYNLRYLLGHYASNAFSTNWGTRIIGEDNPLFKPTGYHYGSVWPLFTGWTALAEYRYGNYIQGYSHIMNNLNIYTNWGLGYVEEVLSGAEYEPSGVCPHQCWSETMVVQPVIEGMLGLGIDAPGNTINLSPRLPADWDSLQVRNIRIGGRYVNLSFRRDSSTLYWNFYQTDNQPVTIRMMLSLPCRTQVSRVLLNGQEHPFATFTTQRFITLQTDILLKGTASIEIDYAGGISVLSQIPSPGPGDLPEGLRIIDTYQKGDQYIIDLEGLAGRSDTLSVWSYYPIIESVEGASFISQKNSTTNFVVDFPAGDRKYSRKTITIISEKY